MSPAVKRWLSAAAIPTALLALADCGSASSAPKPTVVTKPKPASQSPTPENTFMDSVNQNFYLQVLRQGTSDAASRKKFPHFAPGQSSDAKLLAAACEACTGLQGHSPDEVLVLLKRDGWTAPEALFVIMGAAQLSGYCPAESQTVTAWAKTVQASILGTP